MSARLPLSELLPRCKRGILFSGPLIPPVLDGRKTVTRRMDRRWLKYPEGTLLYVCETIRLHDVHLAIYAADGTPCYAVAEWDWQRPVLPSLHMPRACSRCVLRLTEEPRLERVQDITSAEVFAEGIEQYAGCTSTHDLDGWDPIDHFREIWEGLHKKPGERWEDNPEVVRIAFERIA